MVILKLKIQPIEVRDFHNAMQCNLNIDSRINKYIAKQNYDYDFASSNANSYELWKKKTRKKTEVKINEDTYLTPK